MISASIGRARVADRLDVELPELAVAAGLRPVVAEHRPGHRSASPAAARSASRAGRRRARCRPSAPGRSAQRFGLLGPRREPEQLLLDDVGDLADAALEDVGLLEQRGLDPAVAVAAARSPASRSGGSRSGRLGRQQVAGAARGSEGRPSARESSGSASTRIAGEVRRAEPSAEVALDADDVLELLDPAHDPGQLRDRARPGASRSRRPCGPG